MENKLFEHNDIKTDIKICGMKFKTCLEGYLHICIYIFNVNVKKNKSIF